MKKHLAVLSIVLLLLTIGGTARGDDAMTSNTGVAILKQQVGKLSRGMPMTEVVQLIGEPTVNIGFGRYIPVYVFAEGEILRLDFGVDNQLVAARNKDGFDLLATEHKAKVADFSILIDNKYIATSNPVVTINDRAYIPIKELEEQLGVKVEWSEEEKAVKIVTQ